MEKTVNNFASSVFFKKTGKDVENITLRVDEAVIKRLYSKTGGSHVKKVEMPISKGISVVQYKSPLY